MLLSAFIYILIILKNYFFKIFYSFLFQPIIIM